MRMNVLKSKSPARRRVATCSAPQIGDHSMADHRSRAEPSDGIGNDAFDSNHCGRSQPFDSKNMP